MPPLSKESQMIKLTKGGFVKTIRPSSGDLIKRLEQDGWVQEASEPKKLAPKPKGKSNE